MTMTITRPTKKAQRVYDKAVARLDDKYDLNYISYDEWLHIEQIQKICNGEFDAVQESLDENADDNNWQYSFMPHILPELVPDEDERELLEDAGMLSDLWIEVQERDESDSIAMMLLKATPDELWRYDLHYELNITNGFDDDEMDEVVHEIAAAAGIDALVNYSAIADLALNASYGGSLYVIWYGDTPDVLMAVLNAEWENAEAPKSVTWQNPYLCILAGNGSGDTEQIVGTIKRSFDKDDVMPDKSGHGYGWDDVAGVHKPAYAATCTFSKEV